MAAVINMFLMAQKANSEADEAAPNDTLISYINLGHMSMTAVLVFLQLLISMIFLKNTRNIKEIGCLLKLMVGVANIYGISSIVQ